MSDVQPLVDVAGNTIEVGDWVVYPQMSGRSVQIVLGKLVGWNGSTAQIERVEGGRWTPGYRSTKHRDRRTGANINIYTDDWRHWEIRPHSTYVLDGEEISQEELDRQHPLSESFNNGWGRTSQSDYHALIARRQYKPSYHPGALKDYVEEYTAPLKPVTIHNVRNIVKVAPLADEDG